MKLSKITILLSLVFVFNGCLKKEDNTVSTEIVKDLKSYFHWTPNSKPLVSAHRGGPYAGFPENCIATFENIIHYTPALIECDVARTKDGVLVMMHDDSVDRTTTGNGKVSDLTFSEIEKLKLKDNDGQVTDYKVPTFRDVLDWARDKAILTVDIKRSVAFEEVIKEIRDAKAQSYAVVIVYSVGAAVKMHKLAPELMISVVIKNKDEFERIKTTGIPLDQLLAFTGVTALNKAHYKMLHDAGIYCIIGTMGNIDRSAMKRGDKVYEKLIEMGVDVLATDRPIEAAKIFKNK